MNAWMTLLMVTEHLDEACKLEKEGQITTALKVMHHAATIARERTVNNTDCPYCEANA